MPAPRPYTIEDSRNDHPRWWSPGAMRFFRSRVCYSTEQSVTLPSGVPAVAFVSSEQGPDGRRGYCIRLHTATKVYTVNEAGERSNVRDFDTRAQAVGALTRWIKAGRPFDRE